MAAAGLLERCPRSNRQSRLDGNAIQRDGDIDSRKAYLAGTAGQQRSGTAERMLDSGPVFCLRRCCGENDGCKEEGERFDDAHGVLLQRESCRNTVAGEAATPPILLYIRVNLSAASR